jgi:hypothetical protein
MSKKPDGIRPKTSKNPEEKKALASQKSGGRQARDKIKDQVPALFRAKDAAMLTKDEMLDLVARGELVAGHQFRITDKEGTHADFEVSARNEDHVFVFLGGNAPEFATYSGFRDIFVFPAFIAMPNFVSKMNGAAADLQEAIVKYLQENLTEDEINLVTGRRAREKASEEIGKMFAGQEGAYTVGNKVSFRLMPDGRILCTFVDRELEDAGDEWAHLKWVFYPLWKLAKKEEELRGWNESWDQFSSLDVKATALGHKLVSIADSIGVKLVLAEKKTEKPAPESNPDLGQMFACVDDYYSVEDGAVGLRAFNSSGDIAVLFVKKGHKGPWANLLRVNVSTHDLVKNPEKYKGFEGGVTKDSDSKQKSLALGKLLLALAEAGNHVIVPPVVPEKPKVFVGNNDKAKVWGDAERELGVGFEKALAAEYTDHKSVLIRLGGTSPNDGMVIAITAEKAGYKLAPVMIGEKHSLSGKIEEGCYIFAADGTVPSKEIVAEMSGKWKDSMAAFVEYLLDDANGRAIISPLHAGHGALKNKRVEERAAQSARDKKRAAMKPKLATVDGQTVVAPQYGGDSKKPDLPRKQATEVQKQATQQSNAGNMVSEGLAIAAQNMSPEKYAELLLNLSGKQDKSA